MIGRALFAAVFCVAIPAALVLAARAMDANLGLPGVSATTLGWSLAAISLGFMLWSMLELRLMGGGLPMSPYPPSELVRTGPYAAVQHPIYIGAVGLCLGLALAFGSGAALWIVTPLVALGCAAMVLGYERSGLIARFGTLPTPLLRLAPAAESPVNTAERLATHVVVFLPWVAALAASAMLPATDAIESRTPWEESLPRLEWAAVPWAAIPLLVLAVPVIVRDRTDLRRFQSAGVSGVAVYLLLRLAVPLKTTPLPHEAGGIISGALSFIESWDPLGLAAFASWRAFWIFCSAAAIGLSRPKLRPLLWGCAVALALSGPACGLASGVDIASGFGLFMIAWHSQRLWLALLRRLERVANAWAQVDIGPARILVHAAYAGLAAATGMLVASVLLPANLLPWLIALACAALLGAGAWGLAMEGSRLSRPFGFFGHLIASSGVVVACAMVEGHHAWRLAAATAVAACPAQAIGRLRCLVQGCCHGRPCEGLAGIHHEDPRSRVAKFTPWKGRSLYPTAAYSIVANLALIPLLLRCFTVAAPASFVVGAYLTLSGLARFVEEHYRGEPQTSSHAGLRSYQWMAAAMAALGLLAMSLPSPNLSAPAAGPAWLAAAAVGALYAFAMGVEFPRSNRRLSRLS